MYQLMKGKVVLKTKAQIMNQFIIFKNLTKAVIHELRNFLSMLDSKEIRLSLEHVSLMSFILLLSVGPIKG